jgi:hypothetical protein
MSHEMTRRTFIGVAATGAALGPSGILANNNKPALLGGAILYAATVSRPGRYACHAHLGEWAGRKVGTYGVAGCFSFQASKNLNSGEGGAILTQDAAFVEKCYSFHNNSRGRKNEGYNFIYQPLRGANLRLTEFQAALLLAQMTRLEEQSKAREQNGQHLTRLLREIPGIQPARMYPGCTRNAYHLYMFRECGRDSFLRGIYAPESGTVHHGHSAHPRLPGDLS